jgi:DNA-binding transcriptional regulator YdaS (Cro superfamily)
MKTSRAIKLFGSRAKLAEFLGITRPAISMWGEDVPELRAYQIRLHLLERRAARRDRRERLEQERQA